MSETASKINLYEEEGGDFDFYVRPLEEEEKKFYGVFISHSSLDNDKYLFPLRNAMLARDMHPLCDRDFLLGGDNYQIKIEDTLNCYAGVIIITKNSIKKNWVNYELGMLSGRGIPVYLWDPENILSYDNEEFRAFINLHPEKFLPAFHRMEELLAVLNKTSPYSEMFCEERENAFISADEFSKRMIERVDTVIATLESPVFDEYYSEFEQCKIGTLVPNFGMFYEGHGDGERCFARMGDPIDGGVCPISGHHCALHPKRALSEENKECVLLNHVLYNGTLLRAGERDRRGESCEVGCITFNMPVHRYFGTEFKFILDTPNNRSYNVIMNILEEAGFNPSGSGHEQTMGGRIYLSLPVRKGQGLFRLVHEFENNFICPNATRNS